jgi:glycosyltransferase involved in cell wall biosynthesis
MQTWVRRVFVLTTDPMGSLPSVQWVQNGPLIYRVRAFAPKENFHFPQMPEFIKRLRQCRSPILHLHSIHDLPGPIAGFVERKGCLVFTPHFAGSIYSQLGKSFFALYRPIVGQLIRRVDAIICVSTFEATCLKDVFPESSKKIHIIQNGVDLSLASDHEWRLPSRPTILYAGRLERHKNVDKIISAFADLRKTSSDVKLVIVGRGPLRDELGKLATGLGVGDNVEWIEGVGKRRLYDLYSSSTMVVMPSEFEAYGLVAAEAISLGVPTVVANSTALREFVSTGLAEPVNPPITSEKVLEKITQVLRDPASFSHKQESGGIIQSWGEVAGRTRALYEDLLAS